MSTTIDERVVEMRFDNRHFEKNVQTSLETVDKLNKSLDFKGASKGFENVSAAAKSVNMSGLTSAVETVSTKFSALQVMAVTALANITNSAVNAGKRIVSALTIDPVKSGFSEYETQINAVQTILANTESKGKTLTDVNAALDELNAYADKTIYNFTEMTRNIGTFTAAGVDLDTSVSAIKGIANLAAVSGSTSQQASTAMYQLSQALASGTVKLMDWNSVVNAGMGGQVFQDALKETARLHDVAIDDMIESEGSFRETLKDGWLTSEILTETLSKFTGDLNEEQLKTMGYTDEQIKSIIKMGQTANDAATKVKTFSQLFDTLKEAAQSGWTQTWEIIVGDFEEAKVLLTEVSDVIGAMIGESANARNEMLQGWKDLGGRTALIDAVRNAFEGVMSVIKPVKEAFREIFPPITAQQLYDFTVTLKNLTEKLKLGEKQSENLKATFKGLFAILDICRLAFVAVWDVLSPLVKELFGVGDGILSVTASWGDWIVNLRDTIKETDVFRKSLQKVADFVKTAFDTIKKYVTIAIGVAIVCIEKLKNAFETVKKVLTPVVEKIKEFANTIKEKFVMPGFELFHKLLERISTRTEQVGNAVSDMKSGVVTAFKIMGEAIANSKFVQVFSALWNAVKIVAGGIAKALGVLTKGLIDGLGNANFDTIFDLINALATGGIALGITKFLDSITKPLEGLQGIIDGFTGILDGIRGCFEAYQTQLKAGTLMKIASAIAILVASILVLSLIDSDKLNTAIIAITTLFGELLASMGIFTKISGSSTGVTKASGVMIAMSVAVLILASAMKKVADLDHDDIVKGATGIAAMAAVLVASAKIMSSGGKKVAKGAVGLIAFALAIKILASVCADLANLSWEELGKGLTGVGILLAEVAGFMALAKFGKMSMSTAVGIVIIAAAMKILASVCGDFAAMSTEDITKGLVSIGTLLTELALFTKLTGNAKHVVSTGLALVLIGASMKIFASAVSDFAAMSWEDIAKGLVAMAGALTAITLATNLMPKDILGKGVGLIAIATALNILTTALEKMGGMSWESIGKSMVTLGGALGILAIGLHAMNRTLAGSAALLVASSALMILAPALSILGAMSWEAILKGMVALAGAFTVLGVAGYVLAPVVPAILGLSGALALIGVGILATAVGLEALAIAFGSLAVLGAAGATSVVAALTVIITGIAGLIPMVLTKIGEGIVAVCKVLIEAAPVICEAVVVIVKSIVEALVEAVPVIVDGIFVLLDSVLKTIVEYTPSIVQAVFDILIACLDGIANNLSKVVQSAINIVLAFIDGVAKKIPDVIQSGYDLLLSFINGIADALNKNTEPLIEAVNKLMDAIINAVTLWFKNFVAKGGEIVGKIVEGIKSKFQDVRDVAKDMMAGFVQGIKDKASAIYESAKKVVSDAVDGVKNFLGIHSPSRVFAKIGRHSSEGLIVGLESLAGKVASSAANVGRGALDAMSDAVANITDVINGEMDSEPVIRPVLDLSNIEFGTNRINAMFSRSQAMTVGTRMNRTLSVDSEPKLGTNKGGAVYQFTQNNYSPKALSRLDIYRQTKNQFSALKEVLQQ